MRKLLLAALLSLPCAALADTYTYFWNEAEGSTILGYRFNNAANFGWDFYQGDLRCYYSNAAVPGEADFLLAVVTDLRPQDEVSVSASTWSCYIGDLMYLAGYLGDGSLNFSSSPGSYPGLIFSVLGDFHDEIYSGPLLVPSGYTGLGVCLRFYHRHGAMSWFMIDHLTINYPEHARLILPSQVVASESMTWGNLKALYR